MSEQNKGRHVLWPSAESGEEHTANARFVVKNLSCVGFSMGVMKIGDGPTCIQMLSSLLSPFRTLVS